MKTVFFHYEFDYAGLVDIGLMRSENQDEVILLPEMGFFAVSDGMGGLPQGGDASKYVKDAISLLMNSLITDYNDFSDLTEKEVGGLLWQSVQLISDELFHKGNDDYIFRFGATLAGVFLYNEKAIFICLGDSRGYFLPKYKKNLIQVTEDMNVAGDLVRDGKMTKEQAKESAESSQLTAFVGMPAPATPEVFIVDVKPGDRILLCSDGLYGMIPEKECAKILRSDHDQEQVCRRLIVKANSYGGRDNISAVVIHIE